jgi:hypothetical protein
MLIQYKEKILCNKVTAGLKCINMKLPKLQKPDVYTGLYMVDFGDHSGVGFTAEEVAEL